MPVDSTSPSRPAISVIIPTHHRAEKLARAIRSVTEQTLDAVEIVVCADEGSAETRRAAADSLRPQDVFLSRPGMRGPAESRNLGMRLARGRWLCFLDDDDSMEADFLASTLPHLEASPDSVVFTDYTVLQETEDGTPAAGEGARKEKSLARKAVRFLNVMNFIPISCLFFPRTLRDEVAFDPGLRSHEDWDFILQLLRRAPFQHAPVTGTNYHRVYGDSRNRMTRQERMSDFISIYRRNPVADEDLRKRREELITRMGVEIAARFL
ncbi:glycosyltransferase family 2 protein [Ostreiculturibacter nitratireducens]|uniref:glycosyltransferase family 2 protein n=1 Tax=Ostreiculturibacter nitratireducens TaxID=3075226 RepID=UPI0031B62C2B